MSFCGLSFERSGRAIAWFLCLGCCGLLRAADPVSRSRRIEFSNVGGRALVTNSNPMSLEAAARPDLSDSFSKPFSLNSGKSSLDGFMASPPSGEVVRSRRAREQADLEKNWAFVTPEDLMQNYIANQVLNLPDSGAGNLSLGGDSVVERFYQRGVKRTQVRPDDSSGFDPFRLTPNLEDRSEAAPPPAASPLSLSGLAQSPFRQFLRNATDSGQLTIPDLVQQPQDYSLTSSGLVDGQAQAAQAHLDQFREMFDVRSILPSTTPGARPTPSPSLSGIGVTGYGPIPSGLPYSSLGGASPFEQKPAAVNSALPQAPIAPGAPTTPSPLDASSLTPASTYSPPAMTHVDFTAPRRKF